MAGVLSKGIKLYYNSAASGETATWTEITGLQECPDLGGSADKVEVTTLADSNRKYINGIKDFGDLAFTFLYDNSAATSNYRVVRGLEDGGEVEQFKVEFPDALTSGSSGHGTEFAFSGEVSTTVSGAQVNGALTFTMNITLNSDITVSNPA